MDKKHNTMLLIIKYINNLHYIFSKNIDVKYFFNKNKMSLFL